MKLDTVIAGGTVVTPGGTFTGDVGIAGEKIVALGERLDHEGARVIDARGHHVIPGVGGGAVAPARPRSGTRAPPPKRSGPRAPSAAPSPPTTIGAARAPARAAASRR